MGLSLASVQREGTKTCITSVLLVMRPLAVLRLGGDEKRAQSLASHRKTTDLDSLCLPLIAGERAQQSFSPRKTLGFSTGDRSGAPWMAAGVGGIALICVYFECIIHAWISRKNHPSNSSLSASL